MAPESVVAIRGTKQVRQTTGAERGTNVSMICFGNAAGGFIPPAYVFPLKNVNRKSMNNSVPGSIAFANGTGWVDGNIMVDVIDHVQHYVQSSQENAVLIVWDNFSAHLDYLVVKKAKDYGMELITLPPHTSHKLQPLDVSVFAALKKYIMTAHMEWYRNNPGKRITIHEVAGLSRDPFHKAMTPSNLISGFKRAGIYPFTMLQPEDPRFSSALITDLQAPSQQNNAQDLVGHEIQTPQQSIEIEGSNKIQTAEDEDDEMDFAKEEGNILTRDCYVLGSTVASTEVDNRQPLGNSDRETVEGGDGTSQSRSAKCETPLRANMTANRVRLAEIMPIPKVIQNGPRHKSRIRIGRSRVLTDPEEMAQLETDYKNKKKGDGKGEIEENTSG
ncbi:MFS-type transporter clz9 [Daphnia magna]|uniref:MFS-type transporter clz9 n=1 Tax=Daphnia magna TaxID=35525 RepID=UPI001E1BCB7E|nr:MFS-type transporter clz9 [Daphnia magna]